MSDQKFIALKISFTQNYNENKLNKYAKKYIFRKCGVPLTGESLIESADTLK